MTFEIGCLRKYRFEDSAMYCTYCFSAASCPLKIGKNIKHLTKHFYIFRMGGVYGPNEKTILARSLYLMSTRLGYFSFCHKKDLKIDFLHIDNAVQGHVKVRNEDLFHDTYLR